MSNEPNPTPFLPDLRLTGPLPPDVLTTAHLGPRSATISENALRAASLSDGWEAKVVVHGRIENGLVHFVTQLHPAPETDESGKALIAVSQAAVYGKLVSLGLTDIFLEGCGTIQRCGEGIPRKAVELIFPGGRIPNPSASELMTPRQAMALHNLGAARLHAAMRGDVTIHPATTPEFETRMIRDTDEIRAEWRRCRDAGDATGARAAHAEYNEVVIHRRDRFTAGLVLDFLSAARAGGCVTPEAGIVCGAMHLFGEQAFLGEDTMIDVILGEGEHHFDALPIVIKWVHPDIEDRVRTMGRISDR